MEALLKITESNGKSVVSARELYDFLEISERFNSWMDRMFQYGFIEGDDYLGCKVFNALARQELQDYALTIDCAKEISMLQRSEKGKQARQYFIECEKQLLNPSDDVLILRAMNALQARVADQQLQLEQANQTIQLQAPKVKYTETVLASDEAIPITLIAKELGMSALTLNHKLSQMKIQYKQGETWVLYSQYQDKGFTKTRTHTYYDKEGKIHTAMHTYWTEKGRAFLHGKLNPIFNLEKAG